MYTNVLQVLIHKINNQTMTYSYGRAKMESPHRACLWYTIN